MAQLVPCVTPNPATELGVTIPGVGRLKAFKTRLEESPSPADMAAAALGQIQPALAPIMQILRVVEVLVAIIDLCKVIKNPFKIPKKLKKVLTAFAGIATFIPGVSHARMIRDILDIIIELLRGFTGAIDRWISEISMIAAAMDTNSVLDDPELLIAINCSKAKLVEIQGGTTATLNDLGAILGLVGRVLDIIKSFVPAGPAKTIATAVQGIVTIPAQMLAAGAQIKDVKNSDGFANPVSALRGVEEQLKTATRYLEAASGTLTTIVGR